MKFTQHERTARYLNPYHSAPEARDWRER